MVLLKSSEKVGDDLGVFVLNLQVVREDRFQKKIVKFEKPANK